MALTGRTMPMLSSEPLGGLALAIGSTPSFHGDMLFVKCCDRGGMVLPMPRHARRADHEVPLPVHEWD